MSELRLETTSIPGLLVLTIPIHGDQRGWLKENWQREKMVALGLPDFAPVQQTISFNATTGVTRGFHAEPWDKLVSVASGRVFAAWVDLREGETFGKTFSIEITPEITVFVPRGVANSFQTLEPTTYSYLVNDHWNPAATKDYIYLNLADETVRINWPVPLAEATISAADKAHPRLADVKPMPAKRTLIIGGNGQLGRALMAEFPDAIAVDINELDLAEPEAIDNYDFSGIGTIINAAAYTAVDNAEVQAERSTAWAVNATAVAKLAKIAAKKNILLVHISTDYVFDGETRIHETDEQVSPLGVYGQSKAAGEAAVSVIDNHLIIRTSWLIGDGKNFVRTMLQLAKNGSCPKVVANQFGRLTFTTELARGIKYLIDNSHTGTFHLTSDGPTMSWYQIAARIFELTGRDPADVRPVSSAEYNANKNLAHRPKYSTLSLDKLIATGFVPADADELLVKYLANETSDIS